MAIPLPSKVVSLVTKYKMPVEPSSFVKTCLTRSSGKGGDLPDVAFYDAMPSDEEMLKVAKEAGYSETATGELSLAET